MTREEAIRRVECCRDFLANNYSDMGEPNYMALNMAIEALKKESSEPTGHWIEHFNPEAKSCMQHMSECSLCGKMICGRYNPYKNFCPNCGAEMEKEQKTT